MSDKPTKRSKIKYPALVKKYNARVRQMGIDQDYLYKLSEEELTWLNKFMEEYNNASFKNDETDLHQDKEQKRLIYENNNARNRCLFTQIEGKVGPTKLLNYENVKNMVEDELSKEVNPENIENSIINYIDSSKDET